MRKFLILAAAALAFAACNARNSPSPDAVVGPNPRLPEPSGGLLPAAKTFDVVGWTQSATPRAAADLKVGAFATGLTHPRWLYVLPNGDVLVAETNGPGEPVKRVKDLMAKILMSSAGAGVASADRITLLRDADGDGVAEVKTTFLKGLHSPFGMTLVGNELFVANTDALVKVPYQTGQTTITAAPVKVTDLPAGPINHHWTKNVIASPDGSRLYMTVGSNSNITENGLDAEEGRAAIWEVDRATGAKRLFATGLRNPNGLAFEPSTNVLWTVVNERDELGDNLVPDYLTSVKPGGFYGWPYSYYGGHLDSRVRPQRPDLVAQAIVPDYALGAHVAPLGLTFYSGGALPARYSGGAFIGEHGSWNRAEPNGYRVVFVPFAGGKPAGMPVTVLDGFLGQGVAHGRPVGVAVDGGGGLLVADDVGNTIWRVTALTKTR